jgi:hypothetical protein
MAICFGTQFINVYFLEHCLVFLQTPEIYFAGTGTDRAFTAMLFPRQNYISRTGTYNVIKEFF